MAKKTSKTSKTTTSRIAKKTKYATPPPIEIDNAPVIRRELFNMETLNILLSAMILVLLLYSLGSSSVSLGNTASASESISPEFISDEASCRTFCTYNPQYGDGEFGGVNDNGHCLCKVVLDSIPNYVKNKTLTVELLVDQGIIVKSAILEDGAEQQFSPQMMQ